MISKSIITVGIFLLCCFCVIVLCKSNADSASVKCLNEILLDDTCSVWPMHPIDSRFRGANALSPGDVNHDGYSDYITNYEFDQRYEIAVHPGSNGSVKKPWHTINVWAPSFPYIKRGVNPEHATFGDLDGDGNLDVVAAQGVSKVPWWEGSEPGIRVFWGPEVTTIFEEQWIDGGRIPSTINQGHFIFVTTFDVNEDGAIDIVGGGRIHELNGLKGGVIWIEAPLVIEQRRNLSQWVVHSIDPAQFSAHGLVFSDVDVDDDLDIVLANADWDTPEDEESIVWYENPGAGSAAQKDPWPLHLIYQGDEFYAKPQVVVVDLDEDGFDDVLTHMEHAIYWFRKISVNPVTWQHVIIPKHEVASHLARTIRVGDVNYDGKLDIIGMLTHNNSVIPKNKAAVFWMEYTDVSPLSSSWLTHVIKWGSGKTSMWPMFGEKWDQADIVDVDGDHDMDIVVNCEEWWEDGGRIRPFWSKRVGPGLVSVVWFENKLGEQEPVYYMTNGSCVFEAERFSCDRDSSWVIQGDYPGYSGDGFIQDFNVLSLVDRKWNEFKGVEYYFFVEETGEYYVWLCRWVPKRWGWNPFLGKDQSNSVWIGVDAQGPLNKFDDEMRDYDSWIWVRTHEPILLTAGYHVLTLQVCEGGYAVDQIMVTTEPDYSS